MARVIEKLGLAPIILHEQISRSMTVVEKFERYASQSCFAIAVFTPDDVGYRVPAHKEKRSRARQNVVLELGISSENSGVVESLYYVKVTWSYPLTSVASCIRALMKAI